MKTIPKTAAKPTIRDASHSAEAIHPSEELPDQEGIPHNLKSIIKGIRENITGLEAAETSIHSVPVEEKFGKSPEPPADAFIAPPTSLTQTGELGQWERDMANLRDIPVGTLVSLDFDTPEDGNIRNTPELRAIVRALRPYFQHVLGRTYEQQRKQIFLQIQRLEAQRKKSAEDRIKLEELYDRYLDLHGPYKDIKEIGKGAMGVVYKATEAGAGTPMVLKMAKVVEPEQVSRLIRESRALIELGREEEVLTGYNLIHLGPLSEIGQHGFLIETEYIDGKTLDELVRDFQISLGAVKQKQLQYLKDKKNQPVSIKDIPLHSPLLVMTRTDLSALRKSPCRNNKKTFGELSKNEILSSEDLASVLKALQDLKTETIIKLLIPVTRGLQRAHKAGIIHRDIKESNLMLRKDGQVKIIDWGLIKIMGEKESKSQNDPHTIFSPAVSERGTTEVTQEGHYVGTPLYLAPEQITKGEGYAEYANSQSVDIWALGITLFHLQMGKYPFSGVNFNSVVIKIVENQREHMEEMEKKMPKLLASIIKKALEHKPRDRFQTMEEMKEALLLYQALENRSIFAEYIDKKIKESKIENLPDHSLIPDFRKTLQTRFERLADEGRTMEFQEVQNEVKSLIHKAALSRHLFSSPDDRIRSISAASPTSSQSSHQER